MKNGLTKRAGGRAGRKSLPEEVQPRKAFSAFDVFPPNPLPAANANRWLLLVTPKRLQHMKKKEVLAKILAIVGSALVWLPILAPVLLSILIIIKEHMFGFDYLMPAELFPVTLVGGGLLIWAALRA
jgi:hypothetical protein